MPPQQQQQQQQQPPLLIPVANVALPANDGALPAADGAAASWDQREGQHPGIMFIVNVNFILNLSISEKIQPRARCASLWNARSRSRIGSSYPTDREFDFLTEIARTLNPAVVGAIAGASLRCACLVQAPLAGYSRRPLRQHSDGCVLQCGGWSKEHAVVW